MTSKARFGFSRTPPWGLSLAQPANTALAARPTTKLLRNITVHYAARTATRQWVLIWTRCPSDDPLLSAALAARFGGGRPPWGGRGEAACQHDEMFGLRRLIPSHFQSCCCAGAPRSAGWLLRAPPPQDVRATALASLVTYPCVALLASFVRRIVREEVVLAELAAYEEYARTRRLIPGLWSVLRPRACVCRERSP